MTGEGLNRRDFWKWVIHFTDGTSEEYSTPEYIIGETGTAIEVQKIGQGSDYVKSYPLHRIEMLETFAHDA